MKEIYILTQEDMQLLKNMIAGVPNSEDMIGVLQNCKKILKALDGLKALKVESQERKQPFEVVREDIDDIN